MTSTAYRQAEDALWEWVGAKPVEHRLRVGADGIEVRVQEVGEGPPVVFLHGGPGASGAAWASLAAALPDLRCLLVDRPGTGMSGAQPLADAADVLRQSSSFVVDVLDALGLISAHLVGSSHGSHIALLSAVEHPARVGLSVHLGCPGFVEGMTLTLADRVVLLPGVSRILGRLPVSDRALRRNLQRLGHARAFEPDWLSDPEIAWMTSLQRDTATMTHEFAAMAAMGTFRRGFDPSLTIGADRLARVVSPSLFLWGELDAYGGERVARRVVSAMPAATFEMMPGAGHLCWFDDLDLVARRIREHLAD